MEHAGTGSHGACADLGSFLREHRDRILADWEEAARALPRAAGLSRLQLIDFIPALVDRIADLVEAAAAGRAAELHPTTAERHALDRLDEGYDLTEVVIELSMLRDCILALCHSSPEASPIRDVERLILSQAVDRVIVASIERYTKARDRILRAVDHVSSAALDAQGLDDLLQQLIDAFRREVPAVDTIAILLCEGDVVRLRAASGLEKDVSSGFSVPIGEGFVGTIAAKRRSLQLRAAGTDPLVTSRAIRSLGVKALYGVPLVGDRGDLIGVAHMGSLTAHEFSEQDRVLFGSMATRATAGIYQQMLRDHAEQRARALEEAERKFEATFANAAVGIAHVSLDGTWLHLNDAFCRLLGYPHHELIQLRFQDVTHPDDLKADLDNIARLLAGEVDGYAMEKRYVRKSGRVVWVELSVSMVRDTSGNPDYLVGVAQDITRRRALRERLELIAGASELLASSMDLRVVLQRVAELAVTGAVDWCAVDIAAPGETLGDFVAVAHRDPAKTELLREIRRQYPPRLDAPAGAAKVLRTGDPELVANVDDLRLVRALAAGSYLRVPLAHESRVLGVLSLANDETRATLEEEDVELALELARRIALAVENARLHEESARAVRLRDQVLGIVSHDLRDPINTISLASSLLIEDPAVRGSAGATRQLGVIQRSTGRATRLIDDLLDVSGIQSGKLALTLGACELGALLVEAVEGQLLFAEEKGVSLRTRASVQDLCVVCDRDRLLQVFSNLIGNALKFSRAGDEVIVGAYAADGEALVSVSDTGPGIAAEEVEHVFDPYWKGRPRAHGTGLGLFISKGLIESHGGRLRVESRLGEGSTFTFTLPLSRRGEETRS